MNWQNALSAENARRFAPAFGVLDQAIRARAFPGCAFGVLAGGSVVMEGAAGRFTYEADAPKVAPETVFDIASLTKVAATSAMAMLLVERSKLDIDALVSDFLPEFVAGRAENDAARRVRIRHLLAHSSGLPGYVEFFRTCPTRDELITACLALKVEGVPGTRAEYSDPGFILLGKALEALLGERLDAWVTREVFEPLGMTSTEFCPKPAERSLIPPTEEDMSFRRRRIQGEVQDENAFVLGGVAGHAGLFSNVPDLLQYAAAILGTFSKGEHVRGRLFEAAIVEQFAERQAPEGSCRALGWDTPSENSSAGKQFASHSIGHLGYSGCSLWIDLPASAAVVLLTNRTWPDRASQLIREVRPAFHDAIREALRS